MSISTEAQALIDDPRSYIEWRRAVDKHDHDENRFAWKLKRERKVVELSPIVDDVDILEMQYGHEVVATYVPIRSLDDDTRNFYPEPDVTTVTDHHADTFWRIAKHQCPLVGPICGNCWTEQFRDTRTYKPELQGADVIYAGDVKLYPSFDKYGNRLIRYFDTEVSNVTFRICAMHDARGSEFLLVEMFRNYKNEDTGYWKGRMINAYIAYNPYADLTEQRCMYWMLAQLNKGFM